MSVQFVGGGHGGDTTWFSLGSVNASWNYQTLGGAQPGDLALCVIARDMTFTPDDPIATPGGWVHHHDMPSFPKRLQIWYQFLTPTSYDDLHQWTSPEDADTSRAWALFRGAASVSPTERSAFNGGNPPIDVTNPGSIAWTNYFETTNGAEPGVGSAIRIGYSGTIRWEANLGTYYKFVGPADTDGGLGATGSGAQGWRFTTVINPPPGKRAAALVARRRTALA